MVCNGACPGPVHVPLAGFAFPRVEANGDLNWSFSFPTVYSGINLTNAALAETLGLPSNISQGWTPSGFTAVNANNGSQKSYLSVVSDNCTSTGRDIHYRLNGAKGYVWEVLTYSNGNVLNNTRSATLNGYPDFISGAGPRTPFSQRFVISPTFPKPGAQGNPVQIQQNIGGWNVLLDSQTIQRTSDNIYVASKPCPK